MQRHLWAFAQTNGIHGNAPFLHLCHLLYVGFLAQYGRDALVNAHGVQSETDREQGVHLVVLLLDLCRIQEMFICPVKIIQSAVKIKQLFLSTERKMAK